MAQPTFDPTGFYEFDLQGGHVRTRGGARVMVLSESVVGPLVALAAQNEDLTAIRKLGQLIGQHVLDAFPQGAGPQAPEPIAAHAAAALAVFGWGQLTLSRWGDALVAQLDELPTLDDEHWAAAALLGGMFSVIADRPVACVPADATHFVMVDPSIAQEVWSWSRTGATLAHIVERLQRGES